jgi:hypothetical protein
LPRGDSAGTRYTSPVRSKRTVDETPEMAVQSRLVQNVRDTCTVSEKAARQGRFFRFQGCSSLSLHHRPLQHLVGACVRPCARLATFFSSALAKMETVRKENMQQCAGTEAVTEGIESTYEVEFRSRRYAHGCQIVYAGREAVRQAAERHTHCRRRGREAHGREALSVPVERQPPCRRTPEPPGTFDGSAELIFVA